MIQIHVRSQINVNFHVHPNSNVPPHGISHKICRGHRNPGDSQRLGIYYVIQYHIILYKL